MLGRHNPLDASNESNLSCWKLSVLRVVNSYRKSGYRIINDWYTKSEGGRRRTFMLHFTPCVFECKNLRGNYDDD